MSRVYVHLTPRAAWAGLDADASIDVSCLTNQEGWMLLGPVAREASLPAMLVRPVHEVFVYSCEDEEFVPLADPITFRVDYGTDHRASGWILPGPDDPRSGSPVPWEASRDGDEFTDEIARLRNLGVVFVDDFETSRWLMTLDEWATEFPKRQSRLRYRA